MPRLKPIQKVSKGTSSNLITDDWNTGPRAAFAAFTSRPAPTASSPSGSDAAPRIDSTLDSTPGKGSPPRLNAAPSTTDMITGFLSKAPPICRADGAPPLP